MRRLMTLLSLLLLVVGCSSGPDSGDIVFQHVFDSPSDTSVWTATGEAIDEDLFCSAATGVLEGFENEDGAARTPDEVAALFQVGEPFVNVFIESMTCDDGSGTFTIKFTNEMDPEKSYSQPVTEVTWTITGGSGYETTSGEGDSELPHTDFDSFSYNGTGTLTKD